MKDYFNKAEQSNHFAIMVFKFQIEEFIKGNALNELEIRKLKNVIRNIDEFNESIFQRLGKPYAQKFERSAKMNKVVVARRDEKVPDMLLECDYNNLVEMARKLQEEHCWLCECQDHTKCKMYAMAVALGLAEVKDYNGTGCPYKI